jgi:DNA polymerase III epsilon subunit family exonuclease
MSSSYDLFSSFEDEPGTVLFVDTETTGSDPGEDHPVEVAFILTEYRGITPCSETTEFSSLVRPPVPVPPEASAIHHITDKMLRDAPAADDLAQQVMNISEKADFICAHNLPFDMGILNRSFAGVFTGFSQERRIDTLRLARHCWPELPSHSLQALRYRFSLDETLPRGDSHRALFDTLLVKSLLDTILQQNLTGANNLEELVSYIGTPLEVKIFNFGKHKGCLVEDIAATDPDYIRWLLRQEWLPIEYPDLSHTLLRKSRKNGKNGA